MAETLMKFIRESKWQVTLMTGAPTVQQITKVLDAPNEAVAVKRAENMYPNQQFVQVTATLLDPQTNAPSGTPSQGQQTTMGRMRGLTPLRGLTQPGQQQQTQQQPMEQRIDYPYSIALPRRFGQILEDTSPVAIWNNQGQHGIIIESHDDMRNFLRRLSRHPDREAARIIIDGIRSSV